MSYIAEVIIGIVTTIFLWLVLFPVVMIVSTPVIFIVALFGRRDRYLVRVGNGYMHVLEFWLSRGLWSCFP
jgi:hypothetical protein